MRYARLKPEQTEVFMHVYNRVAGCAGEFPFREAEKEEFIRRMTRLTMLYVIEVVAFECLGNHFHALLRIPAEAPSPAEAAARYARFDGIMLGGQETVGWFAARRGFDALFAVHGGGMPNEVRVRRGISPATGWRFRKRRLAG